MARKISTEPSRTLAEFRLLPGLTLRRHSIEQISLTTPLAEFPDGSGHLMLNIPLISAAMQAVSGPRMGIALARQGGVACIFCSQSVQDQARMVAKVKNHKAGFVQPRTVSPSTPIHQVHQLGESLGFSTFPVVDSHGTLLGLVTRNDYDLGRHGQLPVSERMIPRSSLSVGIDIQDLRQANDILLESHHSGLPIVDGNDKLLYLVFKKDIRNHTDNPLEVLDSRKRLLSVAAVNTHDYRQRVPALVRAEADAIAVDSSDGHSVYQQETIRFIAGEYPGIPIIGGNIITAEGFRFLVESGAHAVKVGMGGGSICITQEQKGTGRGLATALMEVCDARDRLRERTGRYIPIIADGGIVTSKDMVVALAMGADTVMLGRYFARMDESPPQKLMMDNRMVKPYWGEGAARARQWKTLRYRHGSFEEGVEGFVDYAGPLASNIPRTLAKIRASMSSCGAASLAQLHDHAQLELVSPLSIREGKVHDILMPPNDPPLPVLH